MVRGERVELRGREGRKVWLREGRDGGREGGREGGGSEGEFTCQSLAASVLLVSCFQLMQS